MPEPRNPALELIEREFPCPLQSLVAPALRRAYSAASKAIEIIDFFGTPSGAIHRGDLIVLAAEYEFSKLVKGGSLPGFDMAYEDYAVATGKHLVMRTTGARITINQVVTIDTAPRHAVFRENFGIANSAFLFPEMNAEAKREGERKHLLILHGYHRLNQAAIALPHPTKLTLIARTGNLMDGAGDDRESLPPPEGPKDSPSPEAIEHIIRIVRDSE
jgi:hypothetical protein